MYIDLVIATYNHSLLFRFYSQNIKMIYIMTSDFCFLFDIICQSQWPRGLRRRSVAARLLGL